MNKDYVIDFIKLFINHGYDKVTITLKNGSTILIDTRIENINYSLNSIEITDLFDNRSFIEFSYELIKEIKINGNEEV